MAELTKRIDFVYLFDVQDGNPNGDPDAGNLPRVDAETGMGLVTDVCLKRKIRNYVEIAKNGNPHFDIFIREAAVLDSLVNNAYETPEVKAAEKSKVKEKAQEVLCNRYYDIRAFGAVIATSKKQGQVRGPIQLTFARSIGPVVCQSHTITRMAVTKEGSDSDKTMGRKATIPYGLYLAHGFVSANLAKQTGFDDEDLNLLWAALQNMFDNDRSAAKGLMSARKLILFEHSSSLGNAPANVLFDHVKVQRKADVSTPRSFEDYDVIINRDNMPSGVTVRELL